jgi:hypothetical protein
MRLRGTIAALVTAFALIALVPRLLQAQRAFRTYAPMEGDASDAMLPPDYQQPADFILGRLMYSSRGGGFARAGGNWTVDYPRGDRTFAQALRRLTRIDVRSVEQPVDPEDDDDIYNWPYLHVGMPSSWHLTPNQAAKIRDYLLRGGFLLCDSYFGTQEWAGFMEGMQMIFPDRMIDEIPDEDPVFHTAYDLTERYQVGNFRSMLRDPSHPYRGDGATPHFRAIRDDHGRIVVAMMFNNDLGDSWQLADNPMYPERYSSLGIRLGVNYVIYALAH